VPANSLVLLAALSVVAIPMGRSPAAKILKFKPNYREEDAYNALVDFRALDLLVSFLALYPDQSIQLYTADRALALFWVGARASNFGRASDGFTFDVSPVPELIPPDILDRWIMLTNNRR
jgi:hypothetical protein